MYATRFETVECSSEGMTLFLVGKMQPLPHSTHAGLPVADPSPDTPCFNGADPPMPKGVCEAPTASAQPKKEKKKKKRKGSEESDEDDGYWGKVMLSVVLGLLCAAPWAVRWGRQKWEMMQMQWRAQRAAQARGAAGQQRGGSSSASQTQPPAGIFKGKGRFAR